MPPAYEEEDDRNLGWEKPAWTQGVKLRSTGRADKMKGDGNLASPITSLPHQNKDSSDQPENFTKPEWTGNVNSEQRSSNDLAKPITSATSNASTAFAKPDWTKDVSEKEGKRINGDLAKPITSATSNASTAFAKPDWTGSVAEKEGKRINGDLAKPITSATSNASTAFAKPDWTKNPATRATAKGEALKSGKEIARPIGGIKPVEDDE